MHSKGKDLGLRKGLLFLMGKPQNSPRSIANGGESPLGGGTRIRLPFNENFVDRLYFFEFTFIQRLHYMGN